MASNFVRNPIFTHKFKLRVYISDLYSWYIYTIEVDDSSPL